MNSWFQFDPLWLGPGLTILIKSAIILVIGNLLVLIVKRLAPTEQYRLLLLAVVLSVALPIASTLLPGIPLLPPGMTIWNSFQVGGLTVAVEHMMANNASQPPVWPTVLITAWIIGMLWNLIRLGAGSLLTRKIIRHAVMFESEPAKEIVETFQINRSVRFVISDGTVVPFTTGLFSPVVVVPRAFLDWSEQQQKMVLWHELAHVKRNDAAIFFTLRLLALPFWFNPLYWLTLSKMRELAEGACDKIVLEQGIKQSEYAEHLLHILQSIKLRRIWTVTGATMTRRSFKHMGGRIMKILTTERATVPARSFKFTGIAFALFAVAFIVSSCQVGESDTPMQTKVTEKLPAADDFVPLTTMPEMIESVEPEYPKAAFDNDVQAAVYVKALILSDGTVHEALVAKSSGYTILDDAAVTAAHKNRFTPGMIDNDPVACWVTYKVSYVIETEDCPSDSN